MPCSACAVSVLQGKSCRQLDVMAVLRAGVLQGNSSERSYPVQCPAASLQGKSSGRSCPVTPVRGGLQGKSCGKSRPVITGYVSTGQLFRDNLPCSACPTASLYGKCSEASCPVMSPPTRLQGKSCRVSRSREFVGKRFSHQRPSSRVLHPAGPGGYIEGGATPAVVGGRGL